MIVNPEIYDNIKNDWEELKIKLRHIGNRLDRIEAAVRDLENRINAANTN